jgi:single-strand DNA-binding protein
MTLSINELRIGGFIGGDVKSGETQGGKLWVSFNLCHTQRIKNADGTFKEVPTWVRVKCFGYSAQNAKVFQKGDNVIAFGSLNVDHWEKDGKKGTNVDLFAHQVGRIDRIKKEGSSNGGIDDIPFG